MQQKKVSLLTLIISIAIAIVVTFTITFAVVQTANYFYDFAQEKDNPSALVDEWQSYLPEEQKNSELFELLAMIDFYYQSGYVRDIDKEELINNILHAYPYATGDRYGAYYTAEEVEEIFGQTEGVTVGIGIYVRAIKDGDAGIKVLTVMDDSPAQKAGIKNGDFITHINGESVLELGYEGAVSKIAGEPNTKVTITVLRDGVQKDLVITRNQFQTQSVFYRKYELDNKVGIVRIVEFNEATINQFKTAVKALMDSGCESLVFDVRSNPGGTLNSCVEILDYLLPEGKIVDIVDLDGTVVQTYYSDEGEIDIPMAVLVDGSTASAGELFTCALKDYQKAIIVGENTYGKGSMQSIIKLPNGGYLRYTTQLYNPPKSPNYDGVGIKPDVEIKLDEALSEMNYFEIEDAQDNQLSEAYKALKTEQ